MLKEDVDTITETVLKAIDKQESQIALNKEPLDKYTKYQEVVANQIKEIGGSGTIHGSIIDINFFNYIYVNPFDGILSAYYAFDIIDKNIFVNIPSLLKANYPVLCKNYQKKIRKCRFIQVTNVFLNK